jgi:serine/threonine protein kinase
MLHARLVLTKDHDPLGILGTAVENKYRVLELAGEGGFSAVYKAEHMIWSQPVAIKFFTILESAKPELREKLLSDFIQEGKLMSQLSSRSAAIVQARDIGKLETAGGDWIPYMVLEWLDGVSLDLVLRDERAAGTPPRTIEEAMSLIEPAAVALDIAHQHGVAHRDLKPANIVIMGAAREPGVPLKVLDFGIAKVMTEHAQLQEQLQLTGQQVTAFTPNYGAPEQFSRNFGATGPWSDVYAMALILVELLRGGEKALEGATFFELGVKSCDPNKRPTPRTLGAEVSDEVEAVFAAALSLQPAQRFARMADFWKELHRAVYPGADTWKATTAPPLGRSSLPSISSSFERVRTEPSNPDPLGESFAGPTRDQGSTSGNMALAAPSRGRSSFMLFGGGALIAVVAAALWWMGSGTSHDAAAPAEVPPEASSPAATSPAATSPAAPSPPPPVTSSIDEPPEAPSAEATASTAPIAKPPFVPPVRPRPSAAPSAEPKQGVSDPWDPDSFGGRR